MNRRIEFTLNLDDPVERAIYEALTVALRHRRAGEVIRQALKAFLFSPPVNSGLSTGGIQRAAPIPPQPMRSDRASDSLIDAQLSGKIIDQSAAMFGF